MSGVTWVYLMLGTYIIYCFYWGLKGYKAEKTSSDFTIGGRAIPFLAFLLAASAASFSGWTTIGHPGLIWKYGLAYAFASFYVLTIPITGAFFAKRAWMMGKRYGFITPGDMYAYYYNNEALRWLVVITAVLYALFYSAIQLMAAGALFHWVTGFPESYGAIFLAFVVWFYVVTGGLRASTWVGVVQFILLVGGIVILGVYVLAYFGGWTEFAAEICKLERKYLEVPSIMDFTVGETNWTALMILTYMFSLMGIQASPAFTMWQFANKDPRPFAWQQVFMSTFVVGCALFFFTAFQGLGAILLQNSGHPDFVGLATDKDVVPLLMKNFLPPVMLGLVFIGAIASMHSTAAPYIGTGGSILLRDFWWRYVRKQQGSHSEQIWMNRLFTTLLTVAALAIGMTSTAAIVMLGGLATAFGFVMYVPLMGSLWGFRWPAIGTTLGVLAGMIAVFLTYGVFKYPLTIHSAAWGTGIGLLVAYLCRGVGIRDDRETKERQREVRKWLDNLDRPSPTGRKWRKAMKVVVPLWFMFAIGPACIVGNDAFSFAGFPALWSWQITWFVLGIVMMWALCFKAEMATVTDGQIERATSEQMTVVKEI
ncbi:MAG: sodium:solute symporter family protein [Candidatus Glassbacteria bacterium]|nr:sodium:solute symporter family protein [Candidatus Glassbacteria bacterium]